MLAVNNLFDVPPPYVQSTAVYLVNYDSTNYSAMGRYVSLSIAKHTLLGGVLRCA